jgi:hypothetical protein
MELASQELTLSRAGASAAENRFLESIKGVRVSESATVALDQLFRRCMLKVGLRSQNLPSKEETLILHDHLRKHYGGHTIPEIDLAFELAITGQLDLNQSEVVCYENFSCIYLSGIINGYRKWAHSTHKQHDREQPAEKTFIPIDWREQTQNLLDQFFAGKYKPRLTSPEIYDTIVYDGYLNPLAYEAFWDSASLKLRNEVQKELTAIKCKLESVGENNPMNTSDYIQNGVLERKIIDYRSGARDAEILLLAKQMAVYHYFDYLKVKEISIIYQP